MTTGYGDQIQLLAHSIQKRNGFSADGWRDDWLVGMKGFDSYIDGATKDTLANNAQQASTSNDLAGASRIGPVLDLHQKLFLVPRLFKNISGGRDRLSTRWSQRSTGPH